MSHSSFDHVDLPIHEGFDDSQGKFSNYDAYDITDYENISGQSHVDIRTFAPAIEVNYEMWSLTLLDMTALNLLDMGDLEGPVEIVPAESWDVGTLAEQAENNWNGISLTCGAGTTTTTSIGDPIDLETGFSGTDDISVALPDFPLASVTQATSKIEFTSDPTGSFGGTIDSIAFSSTTVPLISGDSELRFPRSLLTNIDLGSVTGVRLKIVATGACTVRCLAIRLLQDNWKYLPVDIDTQRQRLIRPVSLTGAPNTAYADTWPTVYRAEDPPGVGDPSPVNITTYMGFHTGARSSATYNEISQFFREKALDYVTQLDLQPITQDVLDGQPQPDYSIAEYAPRTQEMLEVIGTTQASLDEETQFDLERVPDSISSAWIQALVRWNSTLAYIEVQDSENTSPEYSFPVTLSANADYVLVSELEDTSLTLRLHEANPLGALGDVVLERTIIDPDIIKRRKGRYGWNASLIDGDACVTGFKPSFQNFAEYRSIPFGSITPVQGTSLSVGATGETDLFVGIYPGPWGGFFIANPERSSESFEIQNQALGPLQGFQTNEFHLDDFDNTQITMQLFVEAIANPGAIEIFLWDGTQVVELPSQLRADSWNSLTINLNEIGETNQPGSYSLCVVQNIVGIPNTWYVDKIHILRQSLAWEGRNYVSNSWDDTWIPFRKTKNAPEGGITFPDRTNRFQIRGSALSQNASINQLQVTPQYATLGHFAWGDQTPFTGDFTRPSASINAVESAGRWVALTATASDVNGYVAAYEWTLGDGSRRSGQAIEYQYSLPGTYTVQLTVIDNNDQRTTVTEVVTPF